MNNQSMKTIVPIVGAITLLCVGVVLIAGVIIFLVTGSSGSIAQVPTLTPTTTLTATATVTQTTTIPATPTIEITATPVEEEVGEQEEVPTPTPTVTATPEEEETEEPTPEPTVTPEPTAEPVAAANSGMGLANVNLNLATTTFPINTRIPFEFTVENPTSETIVVGIMGVNLVGTGVFQTSWRNWQMMPGDFTTHGDAFSGIGDAGAYTLQLAGCFPTAEDCEAGNGQWMDFGPPITITIQ